MQYDLILEELGEFGPWQLIPVILLWLPSIASGIFVLTYSFTGLEPEKYRCAIPFCETEGNFNQYNESIYGKKDGEIDYCQTLHTNRTTSSNETCPYDIFQNDFAVCSPTKKSSVIYEKFEFDSTVATEFNLICDNQYQVALVGSVYMAGLFFGSFIFGYLGDRFGRKISLMAAVLVSSVGSLAGAFVNDYISYCVTRFITAVGAQGTFLITFGLSVELVGNERKTLVGNLTQGWFAIGEALVGAIAYAIRDWRTLQIVLSAPLFGILGLYFLLPESPRWLIANKKYDQAKALMLQAAKRNKKVISDSLLEVPAHDETDKKEAAQVEPEVLTGMDLFRNPTMRRNILIMFVNWIVITLGYYGISLSATTMNSDKFVSSILTSLVEIPSFVFCTLVMDRWGRKPIFTSALLLTGLSCIPVGFLEDESIGKQILPLIGKFGASGAFAIVYLYTAELFPTAIRSTATGLCSMMARIGGIAAPQVALYLPGVTADYVPFIVLGGSALIGGLLSFMLPETLGSHLPESIEDVEHLNNNKKTFFSCWSTKKLAEEMEKNHRNNRHSVIKN